MRISQLYGQLFIYILTLILIAFILIYGYDAIKNFKDRANKIESLKFSNDLKNAVESIIRDFGSVSKKELQVNSKITKVCFVETYEIPNLIGNIDPIIRDSIASNSGKNIFLIEKIAKESFFAGNISVEPDVLCIIPINDRISLRLEGRGDHVLISEGR